MKTCPNCFKKLNESFKYCNECGCNLDGENRGDFSTSYLNVFRIENHFVYLFTVNGRQVVLEADTIEDLKEHVRTNRFPWMKLKENLLSHKVCLTESADEDCTIIGLATLKRNPAYSNLDKMFK